MRRGGFAAAALAVPGGLVALGVYGGIMFARCWAAAETGIRDVDAWRIRGSALLGLFAVFHVRLTPAVARAFVVGVTVNEGAYTPTEYAPGGRYPLGDVGHKLGPAVSPWQILSGLHLARLGYSGDPLALALVGNEARAAYYAATIFREAVDEGRAKLGADAPEAEVLRFAIRRYNGSGPDAEAYATKAMDRIGAAGGLA